VKGVGKTKTPRRASVHLSRDASRKRAHEHVVERIVFNVMVLALKGDACNRVGHRSSGLTTLMIPRPAAVMATSVGGIECLNRARNVNPVSLLVVAKCIRG